ncbi:hypothetical protein GALL_120900 [mine drainage metagenome]|uniref:Uncharacterized protein n=1 Tax=mine drainage metagenome TaxID=410659 RepID=A0A1J5SNP7_9ZZZZ
MTKLKDNVVTQRFSGKVDDMQSFNQRIGTTIQRNALSSSLLVQTDKQVKVRKKFKRGVAYAKSVISNPSMKAAYEAVLTEGQTAYNLALADYFVPPEIKMLDVSMYHGKIGDIIRVRAIDDFKVNEVKLSIKNNNEIIIEAGDAVRDSSNILLWKYTITKTNTHISGTKIIATAIDLPGNRTVKEEIIA